MPRKGSGPAPVERRCAQCGATFWYVPKISHAGRDWGRFCRRACADAAMLVPLRERFAQRFRREGPVPAHVPQLGICWEWTGPFFARSGYGRLGRNRRPGAAIETTTELAHRISWELHCGPIPEGLQVCHRCDNRRCVRPDHLFLGTAEDNRHDAVRKGRAHIPHAPSGERNGKARLTADAVRQIRRWYAAGVSTGYLALNFEVNASTIQRIVRREIWAHVE